ncbi:MAG: flagellar biosynthesis protein FlhA [Methylococcales bacterium]|jgi:flagellar biosynthesis protein FlhA|nr:flagellar biosynthesis protein FlhA [Methylococcales bacterium]
MAGFNFKKIPMNGLGAPIILMMVMAMVMVPLPPFLLDVFFTFNIALSIIILMVSIYTLRPLDFAVFPSILLVTTLLRLAMNIASTRVVLLDGHNGGAAAGKVIEAFGEFVIGGNFAIGLVVFGILIIINFMVVTKGAGRVSEVSARFTLDAMPGKQMAIDADLNAGMMTQEEAQQKRADISREAEFYGAMDGASKFVRGDAVAGLLILAINIVGGMFIGMISHDMVFGDALETYVLLSIGDGLVAQIPSLLLSTASAIIVTRVKSSEELGSQISEQMFSDPRVLGVTASMIGVLGLIPGMPNFMFLSFAGGLGVATYFAAKKKKESETTRVLSGGGSSVGGGSMVGGGGGGLPALTSGQEPLELENEHADVKELSWDDVPPVDPIGLEVGYRLIPLVDKSQGGILMSRIKGVRKKISQELGFLLPPIHLRDNLDLSPNAYRVVLMGVTAGESEIYPDREMAINPGQVFGNLEGIAGHDPAFGLDAVWIEPNQRESAQTLGYTVVDPGTVVATHMSQLLQDHASDLFGYEEAQQLLDQLAKTAPKLVEDLVPKLLPLGTVVKVLQNLLSEGIPIRDMRRIAETMAEQSAMSQDPVILTSSVRIVLGRLIVQNVAGNEGELPVITLDPQLEQILQQSLAAGGEAGGFEPGLAERMLNSLQQTSEQQEMAGEPVILLVSSAIREWLARFVRHSIPGMQVLAYNEIPDDKQVKVVASVGQNG